jgi:stage V sporulation protein B
MTFSTVRAIGMLGAAALGFGAAGAISGFALGALTILLVALVVVGIGRPGPKLPLRTWFGFLLPIVLFQLTLNGTLLLDVWVLNNTIAEMGIELGMQVSEASARANAYVGLYKAGQNFAFVPYQVILAVTFVVFPLVSRATASGDVEGARKHILDALRFSIIVLFALAAPISGGAEGLIRVAYGENFLAGAETLRVLVFGEVGLALFVIIATILSGASRPAASAWSGLVSLIVVLLANRYLVRAAGLHDGVLAMGALATSLGPLVALVMSSILLRVVLGVVPPLLTFARCSVAAAFGVYAARLVPQGVVWMAPVALAVGGLTYLLVLLLSRELTSDDVRAVLGALRGKQRPPPPGAVASVEGE